jgi:hypothetical protein
MVEDQVFGEPRTTTPILFRGDAGYIANHINSPLPPYVQGTHTYFIWTLAKLFSSVTVLRKHVSSIITSQTVYIVLSEGYMQGEGEERHVLRGIGGLRIPRAQP